MPDLFSQRSPSGDTTPGEGKSITGSGTGDGACQIVHLRTSSLLVVLLPRPDQSRLMK
jgi:hypothetical protein